MNILWDGEYTGVTGNLGCIYFALLIHKPAYGEQDSKGVWNIYRKRYHYQYNTNASIFLFVAPSWARCPLPALPKREPSAPPCG